MAEQTSIQWADATFNPWRGCVKVSPGCANCYAERGSHRNPHVLGVWGNTGTRVLASDSMWRQPARWAPGRVFCASLADVFEDWAGTMTNSRGEPVTGDAGEPYTLGHARARLWQLISRTRHLTWMLLTKRPENIGRMMPPGDWLNVWLGTTVESQAYAWRIDALAEAPQVVPVRFISCEPLLGPLNLRDALRAVQWCIIGGESGSQARELRIGWVRSLLEQCRDSGVAPFVKQLGAVATDTRPDGQRYRLPLVTDPGHGGSEIDWPVDIRVRRLPLEGPSHG